MAVLIGLVFLLSACQGGPRYEFHDLAVKECVERYLGKSADELTARDLSALSQLKAFTFDAYDQHVTSLRDLPELFPELRYVSLASSWFNEARLSPEDCAILENMESLRTVDIYADGLPSLDFAQDLPYVSLRYTEQSYLSDENKLPEASVLGRDFIESRVSGPVKEYVRVADGERVFELIVTDYKYFANGDYCYETKIFVSEKRNGAYYFLENLDVPGRIDNAAAGLIITDANFDGRKDVLVSQGQFGNQGLARFACFLDGDGSYSLNGGFSDIANPAIDRQSQKILSSWRNSAASHSWAMFSYINGEFIETERLTQEPESWTAEYDIEVWRHVVKYTSAENKETESYLTSDYTDQEWTAMFYDEDSFWGLSADKWRTLSNQGILFDGSLYSNGLDAQITEIIDEQQAGAAF
ncbi:MAG: hypothetical protein LBR98_09320 [Syntrophomonadaceae bacterium]|nr:hypothetical protein [Syntrophomonadaceae bacterium]